MSNDTQHDPREVEALAKELRAAVGTAWRDGWDVVAARFVLSREARLVAALEDVETSASAYELSYTIPRNTLRRVQAVLAAHRAAKQPSEPTLAEAVEAMSDALKSGHLVDVDGTTCVLVPRGAYNGAMNALARQRAEGGGR